MTPVDLLLKNKIDEKGNFIPEEQEEAKKDLLGTACEFMVGDRLHQINGFSKGLKIPKEPLQEGEQYRFHFDASRCIGCGCCVVACNEQNNNSADVRWRRVGEIEGGGISPNKTALSFDELQSLHGSGLFNRMSRGCLS